MGQKRFAKTAEVLNFEMGTIVTGLQWSGRKDKLNGNLITGVKASVRGTASYHKIAEHRLSGTAPALILGCQHRTG